ncbi:MAG: hypothetical protein Q8P27_00675, partial [Candidatus Peregrinibacteria bacterium]|nr:hypothetical protein [Candidatus Peregrinibacteria bacterium]
NHPINIELFKGYILASRDGNDKALKDRLFNKYRIFINKAFMSAYTKDAKGNVHITEEARREVPDDLVASYLMPSVTVVIHEHMTKEEVLSLWETLNQKRVIRAPNTDGIRGHLVYMEHLFGGKHTTPPKRMMKYIDALLLTHKLFLKGKSYSQIFKETSKGGFQKPTSHRALANLHLIFKTILGALIKDETASPLLGPKPVTRSR